MLWTWGGRENILAPSSHLDAAGRTVRTLTDGQTDRQDQVVVAAAVAWLFSALRNLLTGSASQTSASCIHIERKCRTDSKRATRGEVPALVAYFCARRVSFTNSIGETE